MLASAGISGTIGRAFLLVGFSGAVLVRSLLSRVRAEMINKSFV